MSLIVLIERTLPDGRRDKASAKILFLSYSYKSSTFMSLKSEIQRK